MKRKLRMDEHTKNEYQTVKLVVEGILAEDKRARDDDKWLVYRTMRKFTNIYIPFEDFSNIPSFNTIARVRRKIQNDKGLYQPSEAIAVKRNVREKSVVAYALKKESKLSELLVKYERSSICPL